MEHASQKLDLGKYKTMFLRRKWWGIVPFVALSLATAFTALYWPKKYAAECLLYFGATVQEEEMDPFYKRTPVGMTSEDIAEQKLEQVRNRMLTYNNIKDLIVGSETSEPVRGLADDIDVNDPIELENKYDEIRTSVYIRLVGTEYIRMYYLGNTPKIALSVVSELVGKFLNSWIGQMQSAHQEVLTQRSVDVENLKRALDQADEKLRQFREQNSKELIMHPNFLAQSYEETKTRLSAIDAEIAAKRQKLDFLVERIQETPANRETSVTFRRSVKKERLEEEIAEIDIQRLLMKDLYTADHPRVKRFDEQKKLLEDEYERATDERTDIVMEPHPIYDKLREQQSDVELDLRMLEGERAAKQALRAQLESDIDRVPRLQEQESIYEREILSLRDLYTEARKALQEARRRADLAQTNRLNAFQRVFQRASPRPDPSMMIKIAIMGMFVSFTLAVAAVIGREYLDQSFTTVDEARDFLRIPSLGIVPVIVTRRDARRRRWHAAIGIATALLIVGAGVAAYFTVEEVKDVLDKAFASLSKQIVDSWPF